METQLSGSHGSTYDAVCRHPPVSNPAWRDVRWMLRSLADVAREPNGKPKGARDGQTPVLRAPLDNYPF